MEMDMDPMTEEERSLIKQLRHAVEDLCLEDKFDRDEYYLRWLRARDSDVEQAEYMLRKNVEWRKENKIDDIILWEPKCASIPVDYSIEIFGFNKVGCPVAILPFSYWDLRHGVEAGQGDEMIRYIDQALEIIEQVNIDRSTPKRSISQINLIFDMNNLSFWQLASRRTIELLLDIVRRYEANHPEFLRKAYIINASRIFHMLFSMIKPFLAARTLSKVHIFSGHPSEWMAELAKDIDKDQLPKYFGGLNTTRLKMYQEKENSGKYFRGISPKSSDKLTTININPGEQVLLTFEVEDSNAVLKWEFKTDYYDIEFRMYKNDPNGDKVLVPLKRVSSHFMTIRGQIKCDIPGQYVAEFNNKYSEIRRSKTLRYHFQLTPPSS